MCLLCRILSKPALADLSAAQVKDVKFWLRFDMILQLVFKVNKGDETLAEATERCSIYLTQRNMRAFVDLYPLLQRVSKLLVLEGNALREDGVHGYVNACLADFNGDTVAYWNSVVKPSRSIFQSWPVYKPNYDAIGNPICLANQEKGSKWKVDGDEDNERYLPNRHARNWCDHFDAVAGF